MWVYFPKQHLIIHYDAFNARHTCRSFNSHAKNKMFLKLSKLMHFAFHSEIVDETSDQALGRFTTTLLSGGAIDLRTAGFLYGMGDTGGECCCCLELSSPFMDTGGSWKCTCGELGRGGCTETAKKVMLL